ncbi:MAG: vanadium-dependent haloperoxidase [Candidatus Sericytochromatia bacterium]|nr:vanadium-dependent haloperoxidase [Candidatus Sericytochromatia bacterium]
MRHGLLPTLLLLSALATGCTGPGGGLPGSAGVLPADRAEAAARWTKRPVVLPFNEFLRERMSFYRHKVYAPRNARNYALLNTAMYDALRRADGRVSGVAAAAEAAAAVIAHALPEEAAAAARLAQEASDAYVLAGAATASQATAGRALGAEVAAELIQRRRSDGAETYSPIPAVAALPVPSERHGGLWSHPVATEPEVRLWQPWGISGPSQFRLPEPPRPGSPTFEAELKEVEGIEATLTASQKDAADRYALTAPPSDWNKLAVECIELHKLDEVAAARVLAHWGRAEADAAIACWDSKFWWFQIRPQAELRRRNANTTWWPYLVTTPSHPSYPSGHSAFSGAAFAVLVRAFPDQRQKLEGFMTEMADSRIWGGIHFRADVKDGLELGRQVGGVHADAWAAEAK